MGGFEITSPIIPGAPKEVINLAATPDVDGGKSVTLSFTCPRENMGGMALMGMTRAEIKRGDLMVAMDLLGYNIWRDGKRVNEQPVTDTNFKDNVPANEVYRYQVMAVYDRGESAACNAVSAGKYSSVGNIGVDGASVYVSDGAIVVENAGDSPVSVSRVDGSVVYTGRGDARVEVAGAVYIVTVGTKAVKVMVR